MDTRLTKEEGLIELIYYRLGLDKTKIHLQEDSFYGVPVAAAPLIHAYAPNLLHCSQLALGRKNEELIQIDGEYYQVENFLVVQKLHADFTYENADAVDKFTPTVKPHYVFETNEQHVFSDHCPTAIYVGDKNLCIGPWGMQNVICHDETISPDIRVDSLADGIEQAIQNGENYYATSYVISPKTKRILITQHCLLNDNVHDQFLETLKEHEHLTLENLSELDSPIKDELDCFLKDKNKARDVQRFETLFGLLTSRMKLKLELDKINKEGYSPRLIRKCYAFEYAVNIFILRNADDNEEIEAFIMQLKTFTQSIVMNDRDGIEDAITKIKSSSIQLNFFEETKNAAIALASSLLNTREKLLEELNFINIEENTTEFDKKLIDFKTMVDAFLETNSEDNEEVEATIGLLIAFTQKILQPDITVQQKIIAELSVSPLMTTESVNLMKKIAIGLAIALFLTTIVVSLYLGTGGLIFPGLLCAGGLSAGFGFFAPSKHQHEHDIVKIAREISSLGNAI